MNINTYRKPPGGELSLSNLEEICKERIQLYSILETAKLLDYEEGKPSWCNFITTTIQRLNLTTYLPLLGIDLTHGILKSKKTDNIAHWLVGLSYCRTAESQNVFINWELQWIHLLFIKSKYSDREAFLVNNDLICDSLDVLERLLLEEELTEATEVSKNNYRNTIFYKTKFENVPDLISSRNAFLSKGTAYFCERDYYFYIKNQLKLEFQQRLTFQSKVYPTLIDRYKFLVDRVPQYQPKLNLDTVIDTITLDNLDYIADKHFPLCMQHLHRTLRSEHHLKYDCRMQYGVFLYWLGLDYELAMEFWKNEFVHKMPEDFFQRRHSYLFKHQYGLVGRKSPYNYSSCGDILSYKPLPNQKHGCPFKHWSKSTVIKTIQPQISYVKDIEDLIDKEQYQKACTAYFCKSRNVGRLKSDINVIKSPNHYVNESFLARDILETVFED